MSLLVSVSTLPPKIEDLPDYIKKLNNTNVDFIHCDVMDGKFVEATTINYKTIKKIKNLTTKKLDVHLMVQNPSRVIKKYIKNGADIISIHFEAYKDKQKLIKDLFKIKKGGAFSSLVFNPETQVEEILPYIYFCDMLVVMSVKTGKGGQSFITETYKKLQKINEFLSSQNMEVTIEVDGGINFDIAKQLKNYNIDIVAVGSFLYKSDNLEKTINEIKKI